MNNKKFIKSWDINDYDILTDTGWEPIVALHKTVPYVKYILTTTTHSLSCADNHIVFDDNYNEIFVKDLNIGDKIYTDSGIELVTNIVVTKDSESMYDFELSSDNHRYYTNGILSHNTEIARQLAKKFGLPFTIFDISNVSASGYVGNDLVFCLKDLLDAAHGNVRLAECGIIFIDEFNKIARKSGANNSITQDVGGEKVQGELLRMIEDGICDVPTERGRLNPQQPMIKMNCKNILFIFSGAFEGLDRIVEKRVLGNTVGFDTKHKSKDIDENDILKYVTPDDLMQYGIMKELVSRITTITHVHKLTKNELVKILTEPKNALIKQVKKLFKMQEKEIKFTKDALELIAEKAEESNTGARALRGIVDKITDDYLYRISEIEEPIIKIGKKEVIKALEVV